MIAFINDSDGVVCAHSQHQQKKKEGICNFMALHLEHFLKK
jgi:hypothetical protein